MCARFGWTCRGLVPDHGLSVKLRCLMIQRAFLLECEMPPLRVVEIVDVKSDGLLDLLTCAPGLSPQEFRFQGFEEAPRHCIIPAVSLCGSWTRESHEQKGADGKPLNNTDCHDLHDGHSLVVADARQERVVTLWWQDRSHTDLKVPADDSA